MIPRWLFACAVSVVVSACDDDDESGDAKTSSGGRAAATGGGPATGGNAPMAGATSDAGASPGGAPSVSTCSFPARAALDANAPDGFCAFTFATDVPRARGILVDAEGTVLVAGNGNIVALWDDDGDGVSGDGERATIASASGLNHGIAVHDGYLYASSATTVYRWSYAADRAPLGEPIIVIRGIPSGGHSTRTLAFDDTYLYVSVGSGSNVDPNPSRAGIFRFAIADLDDEIPFADGEIFALGLRNEVGLRFDSRGRLWGVENGRDDLSRADLGGDIHENNPAEELNRFDEPGRFYGYPYCFSEYLLPDDIGEGEGAQWADPTAIDDGTHTDDWCKNPDEVVPPVLAMQAHSAPLDLLFYPGGSFPSSYTGDLFVTFHGSWNRSVATGYKVMHIPIADGEPAGDPTPILESPGAEDDDWPHRPVALAVLPNGTLLITSDESNSVLGLGYAQ